MKIGQSLAKGEIKMKYAKAKKKRLGLKIAAAILAIIVLFFAVMNFLPRPKNYGGENPLIKDGDMPILVAHRGGDGEFPGNTLEAFYNAYSVDKRAIMETDINLTKDGVLILCHDTTLDGTTNVSGEISDWTYSDLISQNVNFGYDNDDDTEGLDLFKDENGDIVYPSSLEEYPAGLPGRDSEIFLTTTLEDLLIAFPETIVSIEIKQSGEVGLSAVREALKVVEKYSAFDRVIFASFHDEIYDEYLRLDKSGEAPEGFMYSPSMGGVVTYYVLYLLGLDVFFTDGAALLQIPPEKYGLNLASERLIENARSHNMATHYWTVDDPEEMRMLIENGADAIMTDYPHRLKSVYDSYNQ